MQGVIHALLNMVFVSIPENIFLVTMTLILLKRFDMLDIRMLKLNLKWFIIPVIPMAIMINLFRYIMILPKPMISLMCLLLMNTSMVFIIIKNSYKYDSKVIIKTIFFTFLSFVIVSLIEMLYIPIILSLSHKSMDFYNSNILYNFLLSFPGRIMEICIVVFIITKKNSLVQINLFNVISKNKFFKYSFLSIIIFINLTIVYLAKLSTVDNIFINLSIADQLFITIIMTSAPIILITWFLLFINYLIIKEKQIQQTYENLVQQDDVMLDVED